MEHFTNLNCPGIAQSGSFLLSGQKIKPDRFRKLYLMGNQAQKYLHIWRDFNRANRENCYNLL